MGRHSINNIISVYNAGKLVYVMHNAPSGGNIFWVDGIGGSDNYSGKDPDSPLQSIDAALSLCSDDNDDYIYVLDCWQQDTYPISVDKTKVHLIGIHNPQASWTCMQPTGDTAIFSLNSSSNHCEISGFNLSGGINHGCIETANAIGIWIHHCSFGHQWSGGTPLYGIWNGGTYNTAQALIEDCWFYGTGNNTGGAITADGIATSGSYPSFRGSIIRNNVFLGLPGIGCNIDNAQNAIILHNKFALDADTAGAAITLGTTCLGCFVDDNSANYGDTAMTNNPYADSAAAGANTWGMNYKAGVTIMSS